MKEKYIDLMEKALSAYSDEHILRYFNDVKRDGLTEHGFPRLTVNIGILISQGRRGDLLPIFLEMMEFCCKSIPCVKAANDFSVREVVCCILELEQSGVVSVENTNRWRGYLAAIKPTDCYTLYATSMNDTVRNWALFTAVSEYFRLDAGIGGDMDFIELQLGQQLQWLDENGMYCDNSKSANHQPIMYDIVSRGLFSILLSRGYRGKYYLKIDEALRKSALLNLDMQSPNGEMAFGGRSNQFLHNEAWMIAIFEYEAKRYTKEKQYILVARFKSASARALAVTEAWLNKFPIRHIKNYFPTETSYGCEEYAYFDKYMITTASNLYAAYQICDSTIPFDTVDDCTPCIAVTTASFHKLFAKARGYGLEFDLAADPHYDASGLGRVHRVGAPSTICLSCPCPADPSFLVDVENSFAFSLCSAVFDDGAWMLGAAKGSRYEILSTGATDSEAVVTLRCRFANGRSIEETYQVCDGGVTISVKGEGEIGYALPVLDFDGARHTVITSAENSLTVSYDGWLCRFLTDGRVVDLNRIAANRNGHYRAFMTCKEKDITVKIEIIKM